MAKVAEAGEFYIEDGSLYGPKQYMEEQGSAKLASILAGTDVAFNMGCRYSPTVETAVCVFMQTDYAAWLGARDLYARQDAAIARERSRRRG